MSSLLGFYTEKPKVTRFPTSQSQITLKSGRRTPRRATSVRWPDTPRESPEPYIYEDLPAQSEIPGHGERSRPVNDTDPRFPPNDFDEDGTELEANARVWKTYVRESDEFDRDLVEGWNRSLDVILSGMEISVVFAALFSAISTAFVLESSKQLKEDPEDSTAQTLAIISQTLLSIAQGNQSLTPQTSSESGSLDAKGFSPSRAAICINILWFLSLILSMAASLIAMLAKEWCYLFVSGRTGQPYSQARRRQQRWEAMVLWKMPELLMFLPSLMHSSLFLFAIGLSVYLWDIHFGVALPVILVTLSTLSVYMASTVVPFLHEFCPYSTAISRLIKGIYNTFRQATTRNGDNPNLQDIITSRALRWLIETCENPKSVDIALQAIAGADKNLPLEPLKECNVPSLISRRLTTGSPHTKNSESKHSFQLYARALGFFQFSGPDVIGPKLRSCNPRELRMEVRRLQVNTERLTLTDGDLPLELIISELNEHLTNQELSITEENLLALQIGTSAPSHCLRAWYIDSKHHNYELINSAIEFIEKNGLKDPVKLHNAARLSFVTGTLMLISCSLVHCESSQAARLILRMMKSDIGPKYLGIFLTVFALSRNRYPGWITPASLNRVARASRAIDAATFYIQTLDQIDEDEGADTLIDFGLLELLSDPNAYDLLEEDFIQIRTMFIWVAGNPGTAIYTLPRGFDIRRHAMEVISAKLKSVDEQQAVFKSEASVSTYLTALRQSYNNEIDDLPEQVYVFVIECFFRAPSMFLEDCWALMGEFPIPTLSNTLADLIHDRGILRLLLESLGSSAQDQQVFAVGQLALFINIAIRNGRNLADKWKEIILTNLQREEKGEPIQLLGVFGGELAQMFETLYEEDEQWSYYNYCSRVLECIV